MRMSDILLNKNSNQDKKSKRWKQVSIALLLTGILSLVIIFVTIYGQYTGMFTISMTSEAKNKGILISETLDFENPSDSLAIEPKTEVDNISESQLDIREAEETDGIYTDPNPDQNYIAYTFYLKNVGEETVNIDYQIKILSETRKIGNATIVKVLSSLYNPSNNNFTEREENDYSKILADSNRIANKRINTFQPEEIRKFTVFIWFNGTTNDERGFTDNSMIGGTIKLDWLFTISNADTVIS